MVRYSCTDICTRTEKAGNGSKSMPLKMWVFVVTHLSVTHSFSRVNWRLKASPTSFATQASSSGGWMKENGIPPATLPAGSLTTGLRPAHEGGMGCAKTNKDGRSCAGVMRLAVVRVGWNLRFCPSGHVYYVMQRTHTHRLTSNSKFLQLVFYTQE